MYRAEDDLQWIVSQRKKLDQRVFHDRLAAAVAGVHPNLDFSAPLAYQGLDSLGFVRLATALEPLFPTLAPQDFYRYKTIDQLVERFGVWRRQILCLLPHRHQSEHHRCHNQLPIRLAGAQLGLQYGLLLFPGGDSLCCQRH
jgi:acyl carrier protein